MLFNENKMGVPKIIHQIWGMKPSDAKSELPQKLRSYSETWTSQNPTWIHKLWNRSTFEDLLQSCPAKWQETYKNLDHWVQQCDFARYIIVYVFGGIYADLDTVCKLPAESFARYDNLIVGIEAQVDDFHRELHNLARNFQLCQWTFASIERHPALFHVIEYICDVSSQTCYAKNTVLNSTGPGAFTDALISFKGPQRIVVLPVSAFACGQSHSESPPETDASCYVVHKFEGSWKFSAPFKPILDLLR